MQSRGKNYSVVFSLILAIVVIAILYTVFYLYANVSRDKDNWYFSKYQPYSAAYNDYQVCKAQAPKGFDCMMVPLMVSEEYIKEQSHD